MRWFWVYVAIIIGLLVCSICFAENNWGLGEPTEEYNGYRIDDIYYDEYTLEPKGIITGTYEEGLTYSLGLYEEKLEIDEYKLQTEKFDHMQWRRGYEQGYSDGKMSRD